MIEWLQNHALGVLVAAIWVIAIYSALRAILYTRTAQGASAWVLALSLMPFLTLPFYWIFGHTKFHGYVTRHQRRLARAADLTSARERMLAVTEPPEGRWGELHTLARRLGAGGFTRGNRVELLIDGEATFAAMLAAIATAQKFVLIQFYIFRDDDIGRRFQAALIERARAGVAVYFLYDEIGSRLRSRFLRELQEAGVGCRHFNPGRKGSRFQINFRNHRKILVVDGHNAFLGGINVGDDYLGKYPKIGRWRDTHLRIEGPAAAQAQIAFYRDWYWATDQLPRTRFDIAAADDDCGQSALVWHTGPADPQPECLLSWLDAINRARERIWIANPYFVPPEPLLQALRLALVRGVELRLLVPARNDNTLVHLASQVHLADMINTGAQVYRWRDGFMHQKTCLIDDDFVAIGSVNFDSRSFFINFEITAHVVDVDFAEQVRRMLDEDFANSEHVSIQDYREVSLWWRLLCRAANLLSPIL